MSSGIFSLVLFFLIVFSVEVVLQKREPLGPLFLVLAAYSSRASAT